VVSRVQAVAGARWARRGAGPGASPGGGAGQWLRWAALGCFAAAMGAWFWPAGAEVAHLDNADASAISAQRAADATDAPMLAPLVHYVERHQVGRSYAGLPGNWGRQFLVGSVPVYKYLEADGVDEMAYMVPTSSLMLGPEAYFDQAVPVDYALFGIRYLFLPTGMSPPVPAQVVMADGPYSLWEIPTDRYAELVHVTGTLPENRADVGSRSEALLRALPAGQDWAVQWPGSPAPPPARSPALGAGVNASAVPDGAVGHIDARLVDGQISATAHVAQGATLLLSVAFDPGWHAWVDGRPAATEMLAPALVGVRVPPGTHHVALRYVGFGWYPELWALSMLGLVALGVVGRRWDRWLGGG
ncbi:MAG: YfhO family protein, partial [Acidimicrobiales bacterium]